MLKIINSADCTSKSFHVGQGISVAEVGKRLVGLGFTKVDRIERTGEFSVRGDIIDICADRTYRMMFFDDEVEAIKEINIGDYSTLGNLKVVTLLPISDKINFTKFKTTILISQTEVKVEALIHLDPPPVYILKTPPHGMYLKPQNPYENQLSRFGNGTKLGGLVMHEKYGLGRFVGVKTMEIGTTKRKYIVLQYAPRAIIYVPIDQMHLLYNYHGAPRRLDRI